MPEFSASPTPRLSIGIPTFDRAQLIRMAIDSVLAFAANAPIEVIVGDNASAYCRTTGCETPGQVNSAITLPLKAVVLDGVQNMIKNLRMIA
jgi:hypothetical protein